MINSIGLPGFMLLFGGSPENAIVWIASKTMLLPYPDPQMLLLISMMMG